MDGCIYRTKDGECDLYSEGGKFHAFCCNMNTCEGRKMTNYDRLHRKTPEELAEWLTLAFQRVLKRNPMLENPPTYDGWLDWLKKEATE